MDSGWKSDPVNRINVAYLCSQVSVVLWSDMHCLSVCVICMRLFGSRLYGVYICCIRCVKYSMSQKNDTDVAHYTFDTDQPILIIFGR